MLMKVFKCCSFAFCKKTCKVFHFFYKKEKYHEMNSRIKVGLLPEFLIEVGVLCPFVNLVIIQ